MKVVKGATGWMLVCTSCQWRAITSARVPVADATLGQCARHRTSVRRAARLWLSSSRP